MVGHYVYRTPPLTPSLAPYISRCRSFFLPRQEWPLRSAKRLSSSQHKQSDAFRSHARVLAEAKATADPVAKVELLRKATVS